MSDLSSKAIEDIKRQIAALTALSAKTSDIFNSIKNDTKRENLKDEMRHMISAITKNIENSLNALSDSLTSSNKLRTPSEPDNSHELASFLSSIGESVVASQENLDKESINYLARLKENDLHSSIIPPIVFRIPKLKASLKLGIERSKKKKLNVLIYGKEEESKMINQQSVELEIMAVPAFAELLQNLKGKIPQIQFVLSPREREFLFENIEQEKESLHFGQILLNKNRVIFWRTTKSEPTDQDVFLVLYATKGQNSNRVLMWQLTSNTDSSEIKTIIEYGVNKIDGGVKDYNLLHGFVSKIATIQEDLLNG